MRQFNIDFYVEVAKLTKIPDLATKIIVLKDIIHFHQRAEQPVFSKEEDNVLINLFKEKLHDLQTKEISAHS